jgi:hypothetical protein
VIHPRLVVFPGASLARLSGFAGEFVVRLAPPLAVIR